MEEREKGGGEGKGRGEKYEAWHRQIQQAHTKLMSAPLTTC